MMGTESFSPNSGSQQKIIVQVDPEIFELIPAFLNHTNQHIQEMKQFLQSGDLVLIQQSAHKLKGSAKLYGVDALSDYARSLEKSIAQTNMESIRRTLNLMGDYMDGITIVAGPQGGTPKGDKSK
ncbi:MAG: Hpt domain-containing protein [Elusimicrobia bacterium]|nr:Hpt domain-containing protein [Elusimicrobiota bacterium]